MVTYSEDGGVTVGMPCRCVPKLLSKEALLILIQGAFLVSRTLLTDRISRIEARAGRHLISQVQRLYPDTRYADLASQHLNDTECPAFLTNL